MSRDDEGFTLIELLVTTTILVIVLGAVATAFITSVKTGSGVTDRYSRSFDAAALARYWATDVASSDDVTPNPGLPACDSSSGSVLVRMTNTDSSGTNDVDRTTDYIWDSGTKLLSRSVCTTVTGTTTTQSSPLSAIVPAAPTVTCSPVCAGASRPASLQLTVTYSGGATDLEALTFTTTAYRRLYP